MAVLLPNGRQQFLDANGDPLANGTVAFFIPNTLTPKDTWSDPDQNTLNSNPITLDAGGYAIIYGAGSYRQIVKDEDGNLLWDALTSGGDGGGSGGGLNFAGTSSGSANAQTLAAASFNGEDGETITFIAGYTNTSATTLTIGTGSPIPIVRDGTLGPTALTGGEIAAENMVTLIYDTGRGAFHLMQTIASAMGKGIIQSVDSLSISTSNAGTLLSLTSTDAGASGGPDINLFRNSATPAASDVLGRVLITGKNSTGGTITYGSIVPTILDATATSEDSTLAIQTQVAGTLATRLTIGQGIQVGSPTGGDLGTGTVNATDLRINNSQTLTQANYAATLVYTGSSSTNTNFPVGQTLFVYDGASTNPARNATVNVYLHTVEGASYNTASGGAQLSGTWRNRGKISDVIGVERTA